jgi:aminoglycoside/choline kinase family phosphotransferase
LTNKTVIVWPTHIVDTRLNLLKHWLSQELKLNIESILPASADASFRRYFRILTQTDVYIAMDAPPEKESLAMFIEADGALADLAVHVPKIHAQNLQLGFLLLEDLGTRTFLDELSDDPKRHYSAAITSLIKIQSGGAHSNLFTPPSYDAAKLSQEMDLFSEWYMGQHLGIKLSVQQKNDFEMAKRFLVNTCLDQPQVWVHRDYHSRNLMITTKNSPGVIDFQDIVLGPITYDLASLFKDCYIEWPRERQLEWLQEYIDLSNNEIALEDLVTWFDLTGLQRHLKVLGIFCRLNYRDGKQQYLNDLPLVAKYTLDVLQRYPQLGNFATTFKPFIEQAL